MRSLQLATLCLLALGTTTLTSVAHAHIKMLKPASWVTTSALGDPQKDGPCGSPSANPSGVTNTITTFKAGEEITVEWTETIDHPGHYRIALAADRADLKDPDITPTSPTGCDYAPGSVPTEPHGNVLVDNLFPTTSSGDAKTFTTKVKLPNEPCEKCTLQLIQWMTKHAPSCLYYQCADIKIVAADGAAGSGAAGAAGSGTAGAAGSGAAGTAAGSGAAGMTSSTAGTSAGGTSGAADRPASAAGAPAAGKPAAAGATATAGTTAAAGTGAASPAAAGTAAPAATTKDDSGCSVHQPGRGATSPLAWSTLLLGLALLARRRRR